MRMLSKKNDSGAAAVEFAIIFPFLLLMFFSVLEAAWLAATQMALNHAASVGAKAAVRARDWENEDPIDFGENGAVNAYWMGALDEAEVQVKVLEGSAALPRRVEVHIEQASYHPLTGVLPRSILPTRLKARAVNPFM